MCVRVCVCVCVGGGGMCTQSCQTFVIPWTPTLVIPQTVAHQALLSILQARILDWVGSSSSMGSSQPRDGTYNSCVSCNGRQRSNTPPPGKPLDSVACMLLFSVCSVMSDFLQPHGCSMQSFPVLHHLLELAQTHVHWVGDAIQSSHPLWSPYPPAFNLSQREGLF